MIPKIIHYCWFGKGKMPSSAAKCIESWEKHLPDYNLRLWNEESFDINSLPYVQEAYLSHKYAFITDYVRLHALYHFGGVYMDTDVELIKSLDDLLHLPGFAGFESQTEVQTAIMACEMENEWAKEQLSWYECKHFLKEDGIPDLTSNVEIISGIMAANGLVLNNTYQVYKKCFHIFPKEYFCPKSRSGKINITPKTYCIHHFAGTWLPFRYHVKRYFFNKILGPEITDLLVREKKKFIQKTSS